LQEYNFSLFVAFDINKFFCKSAIIENLLQSPTQMLAHKNF
jgi:hypothetical protein